MGIRILAIFLAVVAVGVVVSGGVFWWGKTQFEAVGPLSTEHIEIIENGSGLKVIAHQLENQGIIDDARIFEIGARLTGENGTLKAGEFVLPAGASSKKVLAIIRSGKTRLRRFTIAEGLTSLQIVSQIKSTDGLRGDIYFSIPPEGSLLPETYYYSYGEDRQDVIQRMGSGMDALLADLWSSRAPDLPLKTPQEALILASIVEKETGLDNERALVASVFINRIRKKMRLQSDPTVSYGITLGEAPLDRALTRKDLKEKTPYNTYTTDGLPPGPISNPGRAALEAVLRPVVSEFLYFVADGTGGHAFAKTLEAHNKNVRNWRKIQNASQ